MVVGKRMFSDGAGAIKSTDIADGESNTIAIVETPNINILWCEPRGPCVDFALKAKAMPELKKQDLPCSFLTTRTH